MFASNFPIDKLLSDYTKLFHAFQEIVKDLSAQDQHKLFHDNGMICGIDVFVVVLMSHAPCVVRECVA